jgi:hypothetical protein
MNPEECHGCQYLIITKMCNQICRGSDHNIKPYIVELSECPEPYGDIPRLRRSDKKKGVEKK